MVATKDSFEPTHTSGNRVIISEGDVNWNLNVGIGEIESVKTLSTQSENK